MLYRLRKAIEEPVIVHSEPVVVKETQIVEEKEPSAAHEEPMVVLKDDADQVVEYLKWLKSKRLSVSPIEQRHGKLIFQSNHLYDNFCEFVRSHDEAPISLHYFKRYIVQDPNCEFKSLRLNKQRKSYLTITRDYFE